MNLLSVLPEELQHPHLEEVFLNVEIEMLHLGARGLHSYHVQLQQHESCKGSELPVSQDTFKKQKNAGTSNKNYQICCRAEFLITLMNSKENTAVKSGPLPKPIGWILVSGIRDLEIEDELIWLLGGKLAIQEFSNSTERKTLHQLLFNSVVKSLLTEKPDEGYLNAVAETLHREVLSAGLSNGKESVSIKPLAITSYTFESPSWVGVSDPSLGFVTPEVSQKLLGKITKYAYPALFGRLKKIIEKTTNNGSENKLNRLPTFHIQRSGAPITLFQTVFEMRFSVQEGLNFIHAYYNHRRSGAAYPELVLVLNKREEVNNSGTHRGEIASSVQDDSSTGLGQQLADTSQQNECDLTKLSLPAYIFSLHSPDFICSRYIQDLLQSTL